MAPQLRDLGLGSYLLDRISDEAEHRGVESLYLEVRVSNEAAQQLYRKIGFRVVGRRDDYYDDPVESALVMRRSR